MSNIMPFVLTAAVLKRLRKVDSLSFTAKGDESGSTVPAMITMRRDGENKVESIPVPMVINNFDYTFTQAGIRRLKVHHLASVYHEPCNHIGSILEILKPGDAISLVLGISGAATQGLVSVGYTADMIHLRVQRGDKTLQFLLETVTCSKDSSARIVHYE